MIMDMRPENAMYRKYKVKMEHLDHVPTVIAEGDLLYSLDLKSAYYSVHGFFNVLRTTITSS